MTEELLKKSQKEHFDSIAKEYAQRINSKGYQYYFGVTSGKILGALKAHLPGLEGAAGLDVGCGNGDLTAEIRKHCLSMAGTDLSEGMIGVAKEIHRGPGLEFSAASCDGLPFPDSSFDFSVTTHLFHHLVEEELMSKAIAEMKRVTKSGGLIVSVDTNRLNPLVSFGQYLMVRRGVDTGQERLVWPRTLLRLMRAAGLRVVADGGFCLVPHLVPGLGFLNKYFEATFLHLLGKDYLIAARVDKR
ncbi:MAG: hypothetical protein A3J79_01175 [Elusimicrobia bacterium RIFOXYB2_FULL_62_6]|nr:MAG: hypothetical protein A3J79_01175 [Elusimicrobia bacterium RIFOXYB2_FULL_62_6]